MKTLFLAALLALPMTALATYDQYDPEKPVKVDVKASSSSSSSSKAKAASKSTSKSSSKSSSAAKGGNSRSDATGGDASTSVVTGDTSQSFSSDDDTLVRAQEVPAQFLPMILESGCRTGVNAGGADKGGSGAAGFSWMTERCYAVTTAVSFLALGAYEEACELLVDVNRSVYKRLKRKPDCKAIADRLLLNDKLKFVEKTNEVLGEDWRRRGSDITVNDEREFVRKKDLEERDRRMVEKLIGK